MQRNVFHALLKTRKKIDRSPNFDPRKWPLIALAKSGPKQNGYLLMLAMLHAKISRKWCASRKCSVKRNKSMSLTKRRRSSFDNITFFGPNGSRRTRLKRRRKVAVVETVLFCLTVFLFVWLNSLNSNINWIVTWNFYFRCANYPSVVYHPAPSINLQRFSLLSTQLIKPNHLVKPA